MQPPIDVAHLAPFGLKLEILEGASGGTTPRAGQTVALHYSGRLAASGHEFDSSKSRGEPLTVRVGRAQVISGWDVALASGAVAVGQKFRLTVPPVLAYGRKGKPPTIPSNEVQLMATLPQLPTACSCASSSTPCSSMKILHSAPSPGGPDLH